MESREINQQYHDLWALLIQAYRLAIKARDKELSSYNLSHKQSQILLVVNSLGKNATPAKIVKFLIQEPNTVSEIISRMVKYGLLEKLKNDDATNRSRVRIVMTEKGKKALEESLIRDSINTIMSNLSKEQQSNLLESLGIIRDSAMDYLDMLENHPTLRLLPSQYKNAAID